MKKIFTYVFGYLTALLLCLFLSTLLPMPYGLISIILTLCLFFVAIVFVLDMTLPWFNVLTPNIHLLPEAAVNEISITFDDGPNPESTLAILNILDAWSAKACFFCIGENVVKYPEIVMEISRRGHIVANHTQHHAVLPLVSFQKVKREISEGQHSIEQIVRGTPYLRFPKGYKSYFVDKISKSLGFKPIGFSYHAYDVQNPPANEIVDRVLRKTKGRDILLFHDGTSGKEGRPSSLVEALPDILKGLREKGLAVVPISKYY